MGVETVLQWADVEFRRRNQRPLPLTVNVGRDGWIYDARGEDYDSLELEEAESLARTAMGLRDLVASKKRPPPEPRDFALVPFSARARSDLAAVPWWKRIFEDGPPSTPANVPIDVMREPAFRVINEQLRQLPDDEPVYAAPIATVADLAEIEAYATPATAEQAQRFEQRGMTVSGGGGVYEQLRNQLLNTAWDTGHALAIDLTPQQQLAVAIGQRNSLVREGGAKSLIRHWNAEIRELLWLQRRMP